jgi:hypothetical protein
VFCLNVVPLPPGNNPFAVQLNNNNNNNKVVSLDLSLMKLCCCNLYFWYTIAVVHQHLIVENWFQFKGSSHEIPTDCNSTPLFYQRLAQ